MTTHQCSMALQCKSDTCFHAKPHEPNGCDCNAPCGCWPGNSDFKPHVKCIPVGQVKPLEDCPDCGKTEAKGHHPGDCIAELKRQLQECRNRATNPLTVPERFNNSRQAAAWMIRMGRKLLQSNVPISGQISRADNNHNFEAGYELIAIGRRIAMGYQMKEFTMETYRAHVRATRPGRPE